MEIGKNPHVGSTKEYRRPHSPSLVSPFQQLPTGLINVSIPRALAQALRIGKGDVMEWVIEDGDLILKRVQE
jgi:hypothetical protein